MPELLSASAKSWFDPGNAEVRQRERDMTHEVSHQALRGVVPASDLAIDWQLEGAPTLSAKDRDAARLREIDERRLPRWEAR